MATFHTFFFFGPAVYSGPMPIGTTDLRSSTLALQITAYKRTACLQ